MRQVSYDLSVQISVIPKTISLSVFPIHYNYTSFIEDPYSAQLFTLMGATNCLCFSYSTFERVNFIIIPTNIAFYLKFYIPNQNEFVLSSFCPIINTTCRFEKNHTNKSHSICLWENGI